MKRALLHAGLEVYRTRGDAVHLAERVRENLLMDAGVFVRATSPAVGFVVRAERVDFPNEGEADLFERARGLAKSAAARGYREVATNVRDVQDPGESGRTLDTWFEVSFEKPMEGESPDALLDEARFALSIRKTASPR